MQIYDLIIVFQLYFISLSKKYNMEVPFKEMISKTIIDIKKESKDGDDAIYFLMKNGDKYVMHHVQDCCEEVYLENINGDLDDLLESPILKAEENYSDGEEENDYDSSTYSFYNFATIKGYVTIRWFGNSKGYYSEKASMDYLGNFKKEARKKRLDKIL